MLDDHNEFLDEVIEKVTKKSHLHGSKALRKDSEEATIESLMEVTKLSRSEIEEVLEETRKEKLDEQKRLADKKNKPFFLFHFVKQYKMLILSTFALLPFVVFVISITLDMIDAEPSSNKQVVKQKSQKQKQQEIEDQRRENERLAELKKQKELQALNAPHYALINAIKKGNIGTVKVLLGKNTPLYLADNTNADANKSAGSQVNTGSQVNISADPFYLAVQSGNNAILKLLLDTGLKPFKNMTVYNSAATLLNKRKDTATYNVLFSHLTGLDTTPDAIKQLWKSQTAYTYYNAIKAVYDNDLETIKLFHSASTGQYKQDWLSQALLNELLNKDFYSTASVKLLNTLLFDGSLNKDEEVALSGDAALLALQYEAYEMAELYIDKGARAEHTLSDISLDRYKFPSSTKDGRSIFAYAVIRGQVSLVDKLLQSGYQFNSQSNTFFMQYALMGVLPYDVAKYPVGESLIENYLTIFKLFDDYGFKFTGDHLVYFSEMVKLLTAPLGGYKDDPAAYKKIAEFLIDESGSYPVNNQLLVMFTRLGMLSSIKAMTQGRFTPSDELIYTAIVYNHLEMAKYMIDAKIKKGYVDIVEFLQKNDQGKYTLSLSQDNAFISTKQRNKRLQFLRDNKLIDESNADVKRNIEAFQKKYKG